MSSAVTDYTNRLDFVPFDSFIEAYTRPQRIREMKNKLGWIPDLPDFRDRSYLTANETKKLASRKLPSRVDLRETKRVPEVQDQGDLGACTAFALSSAYKFCVLNSKSESKVADSFEPSKLFIYYNERLVEGTVRKDDGAQIRTGCKVLNKFGVCSEVDLPYDQKAFKKKPKKKCYALALNHQSLLYNRLDGTNVAELKLCLANGFPFVFGLSLYESFEKAEQNGKVNFPFLFDFSVGGHALIAYGYNDKTKSFIIQNSWGKEWGDQGFCYIPYSYLTHKNLADDFWTLSLVE